MKLSRPQHLLMTFVFGSVVGGCGTQLGNGDHGKKVDEAQPISANSESPETIDPTALPDSVRLTCSIIETAEEKSTDVGCSLQDLNSAKLPDSIYSYTIMTPGVSVSVITDDDRTFGVRYRISAQDKQTSLAGAMNLQIVARHGDAFATDAVKNILESDWTVDSSSVAEGGNCKGESCVVINLSTQLYWVRATNGQHPFAEATAHCTNLSYGGYDDWRLPSLAELKNALDKGMADVPLFSNRFDGSAPLTFWTADSAESDAQAVLWDKENKSSKVEVHTLSEGLGVLCVR